MPIPANRSKIVIGKNLPVPRPPRPINQGPVHYFYDDPSTPDLVDDVPIGPTPLPVAIQGYMGGGQPVGSLSWQASTSAVTIGNAMRYITSRCSRRAIVRWAATNTLMILVRAGEDLNAYYDRQALRFFYIKDPVTNQIVFACDAASVVAHELGHAVLDILRPDFWNTQSLEIFAFHEAFGDCHALLEIMQHDKVLQYALNETGNNLLQSNVISRLAKQMGACAYHIAPPSAGYNPNYLRNAVNDFKYVLPETLQEDTPDTVLSKEPHNFSRIWTGAWWEIVAKIHQKLMGSMDPLSALRQARDTACDLLVNAVIDVPNTPRLYDALARQMLVVDGQNGGAYKDILTEVFNNRNILLNRVTAMSAVEQDTIAAMPNANVVLHPMGKSVYLRNNKKLKMMDHTVSALANGRQNPLYGVHVEVPMESAYHFNHQGVMVDSHEADEGEAIESARHCLDFLHNHRMVSPDPKTAFEIKDNNLVRTHACGAWCPKCNRNNACIPGSPEYQKGYKANNNAGCGCKGCGNIPVCDCDGPPPGPRQKLGCFTTVKTGGAARYSHGQNASRKVC